MKCPTILNDVQMHAAHAGLAASSLHKLPVDIMSMTYEKERKGLQKIWEGMNEIERELFIIAYTAYLIER